MKTLCACMLSIVLLLVSVAAWAQTSAKPIELTYAAWSPPTSNFSKINQKMLDMIMEKSQGRIKITSFFGETLLKSTEVYKGVQGRVADMAEWVVGTTGSGDHLMTVMLLPFEGITTAEMGTKIFQKLFSMSPELISEYKGIEVLGLRQMPPYQVHTVKKLARTPGDLKGMKLIASGGWSDYARLVGASPVTLGIGDWYLSLDRGVVEGHFVHFSAANTFKVLDVTKYHTLVKFSSSPDAAMIFNKERLNSLPPDLQKVVRDAVEWRTAEVLRFNAGEDQKAIDYAKKRGNTVYEPTPDEMKLWYESMKPLHENWIAKYEKQGLPAKKIYDRMTQLISEYKK